MSDAIDQTVGTGKAAERIGVSPETIRRWADEGLIPSWRTPKGTRRIPVAALDALTINSAVRA